VDAKLDNIVARTLTKNPKERIQNAMELLKELDHWHFVPPDAARKAKQYLGSDASKSALGVADTSHDEEEGIKMATKAMKFAKQAAQLQEAADLMEEAFNKWPDLRSRYERRVKLWRCGIVTPTQDQV
jgi:serine/threonine-protein kinase